MVVMSEVPDRSLTQRLDALKRANEIRCKRSEVKREISSGRRSLLDVLLDHEPEIDGMLVLDLLMAVRWVGRKRGLTVLRRLNISPARLVCEMSPPRSRALVNEMDVLR